MITAVKIMICGALALTGGIAWAVAPVSRGEMTRADAAARATERFQRLDVNKDGKLDRADREAHHAQRAGDRFDRIDADKSGAISRDEWQRSPRVADRGPGFRHMLRMQRAAVATDRDDDGALTAQEVQQRALARFDRMDANKDGTLSVAERVQAHEAMRERFGRH